MSVRQPFPDQLRGIALLGIVVVNAPFLLISESGSIGARTATQWWDAIAEWFVAAFAQGKSYLLFAALFGYGAALMLRVDRQATADPAAVKRYRRRLAGLGVLGALHASLLFIGDILVPYAIVGLLIPWMATRSDRGLVRLAIGGWALSALVLGLLVLAAAAEGGADGLELASTGFDAAMTSGSLGETIAARVEAYPGAAFTLGVLNWPLILASFSIGLLAGRRRLLADITHWTSSREAQRVTRLALTVGLPCGVLGGLLQTGAFGAGGTAEIGGVALIFVTAPLLSSGYVVWLARASAAGHLTWAARGGRQSLTGYIGESFVLVAVAAPWGLGLYGELGSAAVLAVAVATYVAYELFATAWARRFRQGPLEWLLRWWTHEARPPLRRRPEPRPATSS